MNRARRTYSCSLVILGLVGVGCAQLPWGPRLLASCPGGLRSIDEIDGDFLVQNRVRIRTGDLDFPMRLVVQKTAGELVVIGVSPIGAKLFTVRQRGIRAEIDALPRAVLPISPSSVLRDLHRIRFFAAPRPTDGSGTTTRSFDGTQVTDTWRNGTLVGRTFDTGGDRPATALHFEPGSRRVEIDSPACGYTSEWSTLSEQAIE